MSGAYLRTGFERVLVHVEPQRPANEDYLALLKWRLRRFKREGR